jgi:hypothetical protein
MISLATASLTPPALSNVPYREQSPDLTPARDNDFNGCPASRAACYPNPAAELSTPFLNSKKAEPTRDPAFVWSVLDRAAAGLVIKSNSIQCFATGMNYLLNR